MRRLLAFALILPLLAACSPGPEEDAADPLPPFAEVCLLTDEQASEVLGAPARSEDLGSGCRYTAGAISFEVVSSKFRARSGSAAPTATADQVLRPRIAPMTVDGVVRAQSSLGLTLPDRRVLIATIEPGPDSLEARERASDRVVAAARLLDPRTAGAEVQLVSRVCLDDDAKVVEILGAPAPEEERAGACTYSSATSTLSLSLIPLAEEDASARSGETVRELPELGKGVRLRLVDSPAGAGSVEAIISLPRTPERLRISVVERGTPTPELRERAASRALAAARLLPPLPLPS